MDKRKILNWVSLTILIIVAVYCILNPVQLIYGTPTFILLTSLIILNNCTSIVKNNWNRISKVYFTVSVLTFLSVVLMLLSSFLLDYLWNIVICLHFILVALALISLNRTLQSKPLRMIENIIIGSTALFLSIVLLLKLSNPIFHTSGFIALGLTSLSALTTQFIRLKD